MRHNGFLALVARSVELSSGVRLPYVEQGDPAGASLLLVHAVGDSWRSFERLLPHLPDSIHVLVPTQRGHGDASRPETGYRSRDYAADLVAFMDALHVDAAIIAGGSSGGLVAQRFAIDSAQRTMGLVLMGSPLRLGDKPGARELWTPLSRS